MISITECEKFIDHLTENESEREQLKTYCVMGIFEAAVKKMQRDTKIEEWLACKTALIARMYEVKLAKIGHMAMRTVLILALAFLPGIPAYAAVSEEAAVHAIMGEARGEPFDGKLALAEALRNRGHLGGVYGLKVPYSELAKEKPEVWRDARRAWASSATSHVTGGGNHWFSDDDLKKLEAKPPKWFRGLKRTVKIHGHTFFRERENG